MTTLGNPNIFPVFGSLKYTGLPSETLCDCPVEAPTLSGNFIVYDGIFLVSPVFFPLSISDLSIKSDCSIVPILVGAINFDLFAVSVREVVACPPTEY